MLAPTHSVFGIFITLIILAVFGVQWGLHWTIILFAILIALGLAMDYYQTPTSITFTILGIIFTPLGWFGIWEGFSKIVDVPFKLASDTEAYKRFSKASYKFEYIVEEKI